jgi:CRISPR-associated endonuclease/helicase Cas3
VALSADQVWAKSGSRGRLRHCRKHFRHELVSALVMLGLGHSFLAAYLVAAHHGWVRLSIRALPGETAPDDADKLFALGVHDGDEIGDVELGDGVTARRASVSLAPMQLGVNSWTERALGSLEKLGPFRLAYLEALLRAADMRASAKPKAGVSDA